MSIIAYPLEATEYTAEDVQSYLSTRTSGVYSEDITFTPEGMAITVSPFLAWFNYAKFKGCSVAVTESETLTFSPAHAVLDRIDRIVLRLDLSTNKAYLTIIEGAASSSPVPPDIIKTEAVNDISPVYVKVKAGSAEITPADITSTILDESVCGIMRDGVTGIPTSQLQAQAEALIIRLHEAINDVEADTACMLRDLYDPEDKAKPVAFDDEVMKKGTLTDTLTIDGGTDVRYYRLLRNMSGSNWKAQNGIASTGGAVSYVMELYKDDSTSMTSRLALLSDSVKVKVDGKSGYYDLFGEHNKPSGSYTGTGTSSQRTIQVGAGIGDVLYIRSDFGNAFVMDGLALCCTLNSVFIDEDASYSDGKLYIRTTNEIFNANNKTYSYCLM